MKDDDHIIDYILEKTENVKSRNHYYNKKLNKKNFIDEKLFYCKNCKTCWSYVHEFIDKSKFSVYPKGIIPTLGKQRKECPDCL